MTAYFIYIVECKDKTLYIGSTNNLEKRISDHNSGKKGARYTKARRPVVMKYSEELSSRSEALKRECALKKLTRAQKLVLIQQKGV